MTPILHLICYIKHTIFGVFSQPFVVLVAPISPTLTVPGPVVGVGAACGNTVVVYL